MKYPTYNLSDKQRIEVRKFNSNNNIIYENLNCVNCNLSNYKKLYKNDRYGIKQQTVMCNNCGFVYSNPRMSEDSLKKVVIDDSVVIGESEPLLVYEKASKSKTG